MTVTNEDSSDDVRRLRRKLAREIKAREQAEQLLEEKSEELYTLGRRVQDLALNLQTAERDAAVASLGQAIAHDLNNLIAAISGYAMLLKPDLDEQTQAYQRAERIGRAAEQAAAVVGSLDQLTTQTVELKPIDLSELIETNVQIAEGLRPDHIYLRIDVAPHLHLVISE